MNDSTLEFFKLMTRFVEAQERIAAASERKAVAAETLVTRYA